MNKKELLKKISQVAGSTMLSRLFGIVREVLKVRYLGAAALSDAFFTAFKIPNSLRKMFAEGALSAAFIPTFVGILKRDDRKAVDSLMTLSFLVIEGGLTLLCLLVFIWPECVLRMIVPGWFTGEPLLLFGTFELPLQAWLGRGELQPDVRPAIDFLRILMGFIVCVSSSALLAGPMYAINHFLIPSVAPIVLNIVFIAGLLGCYIFELSPWWLCWIIMFGGVVQLIMHLVAYFKFGFGFAPVTAQTWKDFRFVLRKFLPCLLTMSVMEVGLFIDTSFASFLPKGSVSLLYYGNRFMGIPLGVFAVALATILLPHLSRVATYAPKRLSFYLLEITKIVGWSTIPASLMMIFFAQKIFMTVFYGENFPMSQVLEVTNILIAFTVGLLFFALNKILLNLYYSLHDTRTPAIIALVCTAANLGFNATFLHYGATGLAMATTISLGFLQTVLLMIFLKVNFNFVFYWGNAVEFFGRYALQMACIFPIFYGAYRACGLAMGTLPPQLNHFMVESFGFWAWVGPLCLGVYAALYFTRSHFGVRSYFLD